ncbi:hypothetical protein E2562_002619 [Oryza meyeriana var. granulata]|uniref:DUF834 domain-containing protein n=1 Tax=Oryza meyeriana var. granulata TaxID=110450 RepID=A0A6G1F380_9ORYZ|nr:hypothetical protein E2562_002619 [Oryza meyeriana var. granulata]
MEMAAEARPMRGRTAPSSPLSLADWGGNSETEPEMTARRIHGDATEAALERGRSGGRGRSGARRLGAET